ncbi:hypothetical protein K0B96_05100 [Horticoccus luteus]|uniref:Uncharacterized protein n=1 Tax=Horticoccus luteus TaxID=2862869 RepID=A0A8F9TYR5_9BACT|nr:hypothetical protein [Horticoccus luteus]QYM79997.1 hypothetical protein K0B96_05100 [Horticoccus luteus]
MRRSLAVLFFLALLAPAPAQTWSDVGLYRQLMADQPESTQALETILRDPQAISAITLFTAAGVAHRAQRVEDAGFLLSIARLRAAFDEKMFPPTSRGGDSPLTLLAALSQQVGDAVSPALASDPQLMRRALNRIKAWQPTAPAGYAPGWKFKKRGAEKSAQATLADERAQLVRQLDEFCTLLEDPDYFAAFKIGQAYNLSPDGAGPTKDAYDHAMKTMARIEKQKGLHGAAAMAQR